MELWKSNRFIPLFFLLASVSFARDLSYYDAAGITRDGKTFSIPAHPIVLFPDGPSAFFTKSFKGLNSKIAPIAISNELKPVLDMLLFPFRAMGRVESECTGSFIGPRHILTAAHCIYHMDKKIWHKEYRFSPAQNGKTFPFGTLDWDRALVPVAWTSKDVEEYDWGLIVLKEPLGNKNGWLGLGYRENLAHVPITITGYPGSKEEGTPWMSGCKVEETEEKWIHYECETDGGMSGSAIVVQPNKEEYVVYGVHALGGVRVNSAARITKPVFRTLQNWMSRF